MTTTALVNEDIDKFQKILNTFSSTFLKTINNEGGLLSEINSIGKVPNNLNIPKTSDTNTNTYNTAQFANFIRNIVNFDIINYNSITTTENTNMVYVKKTIISGVDNYSFNNNVKKHIIETLKVINVFVDILEAYKNCIDSEVKTNNYTSGYTNEIIFDRIELVSDTTRFYTATGTDMFPAKEIKNVGYIRTVIESDGSNRKTVLYLSIESFYTNMKNSDYNYNNMFTKTNLQSLSAPKDIIDKNILNVGAQADELTDAQVEDRSYARQIYSGIEHQNLQEYDLTLERRNKNLIVYLLKILFNLQPNFRKQSVKALYYYYKFIQLYSTFIINVSNVMYTNVLTTSMKCNCIETLNMSLINMPSNSIANMSRVVSGIEIKSDGSGYPAGTASIEIREGGGVGKTAPTGANIATAVVSVSSNKIPINSIITIGERGSGYVNIPTISIAAPTSGATNVRATASVTIAPIAIETNTKSHDQNIDTLTNIITQTSTSINTMNTEFSSFATNESDVFIVISTGSETTPNKTNVSLVNDIYVLITIKKLDILKRVKNLMNNDNIINNYMVHDKIHKYTYSILKIIEKSDSSIEITLNAIFILDDLPENNIDTKIFKSNKNTLLTKPADSSAKITYSDINNINSKDFLEIKKKDLNTYKNEYINNRDDIERLNENIRINLNKVENQKNLYNTQYNKNVFLTRQIISYNTIIAAIIIILIVINMLNVDQLFIKTTSLVCLGVVVLLFAVYFISNITYIETFGVAVDTSLSNLDTLKSSKFTNTASWTSTPSQTEYNADKIKILKTKIKELNKNFIGFFEKLIITLPTSDNVDFYKEVKGIITYDKDSKVYTNNVLLLNKDDAINNLDILKYEIENNKLYIMSLLIATIVFLSIYNMYINYVTNDRFLSLTVFICIIILVVIASYYVIRSNRRVRTFYKNIYWGPETSVRF